MPTIATLPPDEKVIPIKPTLRNFRRHSTMFFAGVTAISMIGLMAALSLKPTFYAGIRGRQPDTAVITVPRLLEYCQLPYQGCHDPQATIDSLPYPNESKLRIRQISEHQNINPSLLLTLHHIIHNTNPTDANIDTTLLSQLATDFNRHRPRTTPIIPKVHQHSTFGYYQTSNLNHADYIVFTFLATRLPTKTSLDTTLSHPTTSPQPQNTFQYIFTTLSVE